MHGISVYLLDLDSLNSILVAVGDISPRIGTAQETIIPGGYSRESNVELLLGCLNIIRDSECIVKDRIDQFKGASLGIARFLRPSDADRTPGRGTRGNL